MTAPNAACNAASAYGLTMGMAIMAALFLWAVVHLLLAARWIRRDLHDVPR